MRLEMNDPERELWLRWQLTEADQAPTTQMRWFGPVKPAFSGSDLLIYEHNGKRYPSRAPDGGVKRTRGEDRV